MPVTSSAAFRERSCRLIVPACLILLLAHAPAAGQQRPWFRSTVELVQLQVGVGDERGAFVPGLTADDFAVLVDGEERSARSAYEVDLRATAAPATVAREGFAAIDAGPPAAARRHFLLFFDLSYTSRQGILEARRSALDLIDSRVHPDDMLAVATGNRYGIQLLTPFTGDHGHARTAVETLGLASVTDLVSGGNSFDESILQAIREQEGPGRNIGSVSNVEQMLFLTRVAEVGNHVSQLAALGDMLQAIEGRKHVLFFSRGFDDEVVAGQGLETMARHSEDRLREPKLMLYDTPEMTFGNSGVREALTSLVSTFRNADAVIHAIDPTGLRVASLHDPSRQESTVYAWEASEQARLSTGDGHQALMALASGTGGTANWSFADLTEPLAQILESTSAYYVIAYRKQPEDAPTVSIEVRVRRAGVRVLSAPSRLTPPPAYTDMSAAQRQLQLAEFLGDDSERRDIAFDLEMFPFRAPGQRSRAVVAMGISGIEMERLALLRGDDTVQLEIGAFAFGDDGELEDHFRHRVRVDVGAMRRRGPLYEQAFRYAGTLELPAGENRLRFLLREAEVGQLSGVTQRLAVAAPTAGPALARPMVVSDEGAPHPPDHGGSDEPFDPLQIAGRRLSPVANPQIASGDAILLVLLAYDLPRDTAGRLVPGISFEIVDARGQAHGLQDFEILGVAEMAPSGTTQLLVRATLPQALPSGLALLHARLTEPNSGEQWQESSPLTVVSGR